MAHILFLIIQLRVRRVGQWPYEAALSPCRMKPEGAIQPAHLSMLRHPPSYNSTYPSYYSPGCTAYSSYSCLIPMIRLPTYRPISSKNHALTPNPRPIRAPGGPNPAIAGRHSPMRPARVILQNARVINRWGSGRGLERSPGRDGNWAVGGKARHGA